MVISQKCMPIIYSSRGTDCYKNLKFWVGGVNSSLAFNLNTKKTFNNLELYSASTSAELSRVPFEKPQMQQKVQKHGPESSKYTS